MSRLVFSLTAIVIIGVIAVWPAPAASYQLPIPNGIPGIPGLNSSVLGQAQSFFNQATSKASPETATKISELVSLFKSGAQSGDLTDGTSQVKKVFPNANAEQQAVLRTTGYSGLLSQLGTSGLEKLGGANVQSLLSGYSQAQTTMNDILHKNKDTASSVISHL